MSQYGGDVQFELEMHSTQSRVVGLQYGVLPVHSVLHADASGTPELPPVPGVPPLLVWPPEPASKLPQVRV
jgi:hypothetical protein